ncbi:MAG: hypothetical protein AAF282_02330 [Cyanobacteria bacterium P01_A01_bin.15]
MDKVPFNSTQDNTAPSLTDEVAKLLNQLPLQIQHQVLDFVEFLLHRHQRHQVDRVIQPTQDELEKELDLWEMASDEDWLTVETQLMARENG